MNPIVAFPLRAKSTASPLVVEFSSEKSGRVIIPNNYWGKGEDHDHWISCYDGSVWTILAAEPASNETQGRKAEVLGGLPPSKEMNNTPFVLPEKWFIRTLNPVFSAEIQKQFFKLGWKWLSDDEIVKYENDPILRQSDGAPSRFIRLLNFQICAIAGYTEITIEQLFSLSPSPKEIKFRIAGYKGAATAETVKVGCQEMTMANYKEMRKEIEEYRKPKPDKNLSNKFKDSRTEVVISPRGISFASTEFGACHLEYKEFDELDKKITEL